MNRASTLDVTYCDTCSDELEEGQVGVCSTCKVYTFDELSESAKDTARDEFKYRDGYPDYDWWDSVYEDANRIAKIFGLDIETTQRAKNGRSITNIDISFSGFSSQGDGASFKGRYTYNPKAVEEINAYCHNVELIRIASELTVMQTTRRLLSLAPLSANITTSGGYSHSHLMNLEVNSEDEDDEHNQISDAVEDQFAQLMRDFADWIYKTLEAEYDHLMSDEVVDGCLEQEKFDEDGAVV